MSVPVASEQRKSFLPLRLPAPGSVGPRPTLSMPAGTETNNNKSSLTVGDRVLVNGLKSGVLRYIGHVQFAQGSFCGVELDEAEGKHDGEVKDVRYFQCAANHGIFVPKEKVTSTPRTRATSSQRPVSRLKPPTLTRSITLTSAINHIESAKPVQLPDIVPNSTTQAVTVNQPIENEKKHETILSTDKPQTPIEPLPISIDEPPETIDADFTDSVSLILHQLQQEQQAVTRLSSSIAISEEESDDEDDIDTESVIESIAGQTHRSSTSSVFVPINQSKFIQTDLSFSSKDNISFTKKPTPIQPVKKPIEKRPIAPVTNVAKRSIAKKPTTITPAKKASIPRAQLNSAQSVTSLPSQSSRANEEKNNNRKLELLSRSSRNSLSSSQSDVASLPKPISDKAPPLPPSASSESKSNESHQRLQTSHQHLLRQFDLMTILNQYFLTENQQIQQEYQQQLSKIRIKTDQLKNSIEQLQISHQNELSSLTQESQIETERLNQAHEQQLNECQQKTDELLKERNELDSRCGVLQEKVDGFLTEMANSEHADVLLCHVETLEKDRTSLQTVLELKNKEITQLRTKINEQEIKLTDEKALQKRIEMADNRVQDLEWLLRDKQLSEKAAVFERDELKERAGQLERDYSQIKFSNETLRYRLQQFTGSISTSFDTPVEFIRNPIRRVRTRKRANSFSSTRIAFFDNQRKTRSLICIFHR